MLEGLSGKNTDIEGTTWEGRQRSGVFIEQIFSLESPEFRFHLFFQLLFLIVCFDVPGQVQRCLGSSLNGCFILDDHMQCFFAQLITIMNTAGELIRIYKKKKSCT